MQIIDRQFFITIVIIVNISHAALGQFARLLCMGGSTVEAGAAAPSYPGLSSCMHRHLLSDNVVLHILREFYSPIRQHTNFKA